MQHIVSSYPKYISQLVKLKTHLLLPKRLLGWTIFTDPPWTRLCIPLQFSWQNYHIPLEECVTAIAANCPTMLWLLTSNSPYFPWHWKGWLQNQFPSSSITESKWHGRPWQAFLLMDFAKVWGRVVVLVCSVLFCFVLSCLFCLPQSPLPFPFFSFGHGQNVINR